VFSAAPAPARLSADKNNNPHATFKIANFERLIVRDGFGFKADTI
jgi:hypothetical protein